MKENELVRDMYSRLNLIINELNSIGINKLGDADIVRKIISLLPEREMCPWAISKYFGDQVPTQMV
jgi:hypothetical protein